jgi:hypothetical protein
MRTLPKILIACSLAMLLASPALADKGGNGNGNGNGGGNSENSGNNGGGNNGNGNGNGGGNGNSNGNGNSSGNGKPDAVVNSNAIVVVPDDQQVVQNAVRAKSALSLEAITAVVASDSDGRILDVQLVTFKGIYLYDVTVLERDGVLHKLYYNARSGVRVRTQ